MTKRYHYLPLAKINAGMVLADDLLDKLGHVLLPAGTVLTASMLRSVEQHDIHLLSVEMNALSETESSDEKLAQLKRLGTLFRQPPYEEPTCLLKDYVYEYRQGEPK
ncbi:MAG: hypothetical protein KGM99_06725 [Burkholderiales bacterium]|nr:hypothetical protein [Burkholderiales bacterium]